MNKKQRVTINPKSKTEFREIYESNGNKTVLLISKYRIVDMYYNAKTNKWEISLRKRTFEIDGKTYSDEVNLRFYNNKNLNFAMAYLNKKQKDLGFFD
jgi:hypothetical protein